MDTTSSFRWWNALPSVIADFVFKDFFGIFASQSDTDKAKPFFGYQSVKIIVLSCFYVDVTHLVN
jgi:hypothetical protein